MSAPRPRPVTATVRRPPPAGTYKARRNVSLLSDSSGSTESLLSCVDDSEGTTPGHHFNSDRSDVQTAKRRDSPTQSENTNNNSSDASFSERIASEKSALTSITQTEEARPGEEKEPEVGPWEKWMIKKSESMKKLAQQKQMLEKMRKEQERQQEMEKKEREMKAERQRQQWLALKDEEKVKAERRKLLREKKKQREEERKKREIEEKAERKYQEWLEQKKKTDERQHAFEIEQRKLKELELKNKKERSDAAFRAWLERSMQRTRCIPHSYARCDGTITGYHDTGASPSPSYYNPIPWQPVAIPPTHHPKPSKSKGRKNTKRNAWTMDD